MRKGQIWYIPLVSLLITTLCWQCKEPKPEPSKEVATKTETIPKLILELAEFGGLSIPDTADVNQYLSFVMIDSAGKSMSSEISQVSKGYKQMMSKKRIAYIPVMEIKDSDKVITVFQGRGYAGPIWAKLLIDRKQMIIEKLELDHSVESEGYGDAITYASFEGQFTKLDLNLEGTAFGLDQRDARLIEGIHQIDGVSGATQTSRAVVEMINNGLSLSSGYLNDASVN